MSQILNFLLENGCAANKSAETTILAFSEITEESF